MSGVAAHHAMRVLTKQKRGSDLAVGVLQERTMKILEQQRVSSVPVEQRL